MKLFSPPDQKMNIVNEAIIIKILTSNDPTPIKVLKWDINTNIIKAGNNYCSEVSRLTIDYEKNDVKMKKIFFLKVPFNSPTYESLKKYGAYDKEMLMYTEVLPQMYTIEQEYFTARHYFFDDKLSLFLKDLSLSGYKTGDRIEQLDIEQCYYALRCLAKFHGLSVKLDQMGSLSHKIKHDTFFYTGNQDIEAQKDFLSGIKMFIDNLDLDIKQRYAKQVEAFANICWQDVLDVTIPLPDSFCVLLHGDFWTNNIMFKYDKYGIVKKVKLIDFQLIRWGSPAIDLIYFIITSMRFEVYEKYLHLFLKVYLDNLNKILKTLNCQTYQMDKLVEDIDSRGILACLVFSCLLPFIISNPDDPIDMVELNKDNTFNMGAVAKAYKHKCFMDIATKWFLYYVQKGIFDTIKDHRNGSTCDKACSRI